MQTEFSHKRALIAIFLAAVLTFSLPVNIVSMNHISSSDEKSYSVQSEIKNPANPVTYQPADDNKLQDTAADTLKNENKASYNTQITHTAADNTAIKENAVSLEPENHLAADNSTAKGSASEESASHDGTIIVPAMLNNIMRDSLSTIVSKKIYTFTAQERGTIVYAFNHVLKTEIACLWYITLYEEYSPDGTGNTTAYRVLNRLTYENIGKGVQSSTIGVLPGNYRLEIECITGHTAEKYDVLIGFNATDDYETEYNDTISRYTHLPVNKTINGSASLYPDDVTDIDCYIFRITDTGYTVLYFDHEADAAGLNRATAWRISLTDEWGNEYFYTTSDMDKAEINSGVMGLPPGYYYVYVYSHVYSSVPYALNVSFTKDSAIEAEPNDTKETADVITVNSEKIGSLTLRNDKSDRDYFAFDLKKDGFIVIDFIHEALEDTKDGWNITIMAEDGRIAYNTVSDWNQAVLQSPSIGLKAGRYYIRVDSDNLYHNSIVYRLILMTIESEGWETEPNNDLESADLISLGATVSGTMVELGTSFDKDYFAIDIAQEGKLGVAFGHIITDEPDKEGWVISVADKDGNIIKSITSDWDSDAETLAVAVAPGRYYIIIETGLYFNTARYIFTTSLT